MNRFRRILGVLAFLVLLISPARADQDPGYSKKSAAQKEGWDDSQ